MPRRRRPPTEETRPRVVLLDLGGVIIDIDPRACFVSWASAAGVEVATIAPRWAVDDAYKAFETGEIGFDEYYHHLSRRLGITLTRQQWQTGWNELLRDPFSEVAAILPRLAREIPLYVFSNTNPVHQEAFQFRCRGALAPIRKIYTSWEIGLRKPAVESYRAVADDIGVAPSDILFVDDNADNVAAARTAGLDGRRVSSPAETAAILEWVLPSS